MWFNVFANLYRKYGHPVVVRTLGTKQCLPPCARLTKTNLASVVNSEIFRRAALKTHETQQVLKDKAAEVVKQKLKYAAHG